MPFCTVKDDEGEGEQTSIPSRHTVCISLTQGVRGKPHRHRLCLLMQYITVHDKNSANSRVLNLVHDVITVHVSQCMTVQGNVLFRVHFVLILAQPSTDERILDVRVRRLLAH